MITREELEAVRRDLGARLADLRKAKGLSQLQLGRRVGYTRSAVANVETGRENTPRRFWAECDGLLGADGALLAGYDDLDALVVAYREQNAEDRHLQRRQRLAGQPPQPDSRDPGRLIRAGAAIGPIRRLDPTAVWGLGRHRLELPSGPPAALSQPGAVQALDGLPVVVDVEAAAYMAAQESSQHAAGVGGGVDSASVEQVQQQVWRLARRYHELAPIRLLAEARQARNLAYQLLDRTRRPSQTSQLYLAAGQACGLMALASFDLAFWDAAEDQIRAARTYAEIVDHRGLRSWSVGTLALIAYWTGQPRRALNVVQAGIAQAPAGVAVARLHGIQARAWSHLGDQREVTDALRLADAAMDAADGDDELHDGVGGEFGWGRGLHAACAGTALLRVGDADGAAQRIRAALDALPHDPHGGLVPTRAYIDLAAAELAAGRFDAAQAALDHVWDVPPAHRRHGLTARLDRVAHTLTEPGWCDHQPAVQLRDHIEVFTSEAVAQRALPGP